ncbi:MAG: hypothetical protein AAGA48_16845 [Myxococcota bacterium]
MNLHPIGLAIVVYLVGMVAIALWARGRVTNVEEFVLAGRTLGIRVISSSLLATWIGAGTLLVAADEIAAVGLSGIALEPIGSGCALIIGGVMAARIRSYRVVTLPDLYRKMYGPRAEGLLAAVTIPADMTWLAVQYYALGAVIELYLGVSLEYAVPAIAAIGLLKTLLGGLHSIAMTDVVQVGVTVFSVLLVGLACLVKLGNGWPLEGLQTLQQLGEERLRFFPGLDEAPAWLALWLAASFGNASDQTLIQRVSAARTPRIATLACFAAGMAYLAVGIAPVIAGLTASLVMPSHQGSVMPALAGLLLDPWFAAPVMVAMVATMLSTIDSNLMSPSTVLARNVGTRMLGLDESVGLHRMTLALVAAVTVGLALSGVRPFRLLAMSYEVGLVATVVPVVIGLWRPASEATALASIGLGGATWLYLTITGRTLPFLDIPPALTALLLAAIVYIGMAFVEGSWRMCRHPEDQSSEQPSST